MAFDLNNRAQVLDLALSHIECQCGPRGNALKFYTSMRLDVRRSNVLKRGEDVVGNRTRVRVVKNKLAPPFRQAEFDVLYSQGVSRTGELLDLALQQGLIAKNGAWFSYQATPLGQGREQAKTFLQASTDIVTALELHIRQKLGLAIPIAT